jgi:uncharacterized membrane protein YfhO
MELLEYHGDINGNSFHQANSIQVRRRMIVRWWKGSSHFYEHFPEIGTARYDLHIYIYAWEAVWTILFFLMGFTRNGRFFLFKCVFWFLIVRGCEEIL